MKFIESKESGPHKMLADLAGEWQGMTKTWFEPGVVADESPMTGTIREVLGGRFVIHEYKGELTGKPFEGICLIGCDLGSEQFQSAWIDSFHMSTAIMFSEGDAGESFKAKGTYYTGSDSPRWGWRTEIEMPSGDDLVLRAYNVSPEGEESIATETIYSRKS